MADERAPYPIGHAAKLVGVSLSTLRLWEEQGLLQPVKAPSGRRSYTEAAIARARRIQLLRRVWGLGTEAIRRTLDAEDGVAETPNGAPGEEPASDAAGARVRDLRQGNGLSLDALSRKTGIAPSHLSMFERGIAHISPARLAAVATALGVPLADLMGGTPTRNSDVVRRGQGRIVGYYGPGVLIEQLTVAQHLMDAELWAIEPGQGSDGFYAHRGEELIHVIQGALEIELAGGAPDLLQPGDSAYFSSTRDHRWSNPGPHRTVALWVNTDTDRLATMTFERSGNRLALGASSTLGTGEGGLSVELPSQAQTFRVIETHTAGHPTRILIEPLAGLDGATVGEKAAQFRERYDALRPLLLHEPRGHSGSFGLIPTASERADFGAFFVSSHGYPTMCGHALIGYAAVLRALGRLAPGQGFSVEVPAGVFEVEPEGGDGRVALRLPRASVLAPAIEITAQGRTGHACLAFGGEVYAIVEAADFGLALERAERRQLLAAGLEIRAAPALAAAVADLAGGEPLSAVLFVAPGADGIEQQFVAIDALKYDRSPGVTGLAARIAQRRQSGRLDVGETAVAESLFGGRLQGRVVEELSPHDGTPPGCAVVVSGRAHLHGVSTLIHDAEDPMGGGFLG